jgi:hypothetical protein
MADPAKDELLRSLGKLVRGLSALFWGLPLALVFYVQIAQADWLDFFGVLFMTPVITILWMLCVGGLLWHGLAQMRHFQKQERVWQNALTRAEVLAIVNMGLSPFLFWWHRMPAIPLYSACVSVLSVTCLLFLIQVNLALIRLTAMLPDEILRSETRLFTRFNISLLSAVFALMGMFLMLSQWHDLPWLLMQTLVFMAEYGVWASMFLTLMPMAMTMVLIWKIKEVIFSSVFNAGA